MSTTSDIGTRPLETRHEGKVTAQIERKTARVPSGAYLGMAVGSMVASALLQLAGKRQTANFIGQWVPSLLVIGVYNKLVKIEHELRDAIDQTSASGTARSGFGGGI
jgi:hypothetical protein